MKDENFVLIIGGGPVGLTAAIELGWRGVPTTLISANTETVRHPKCNSANARSMEFFHRLGLADQIRADGLPSGFSRDTTYVTRYCGHELGRIPRPFTAIQRGKGPWQTAQLPHAISQIRLEPILKRAAESYDCVDVNFGWKLNALTDTADGVLATVENVQSGEQKRIKAQYVIGADGARSPMRKHIGAEMKMLGEFQQRAFMGGSMLSLYIRAPGLLAASGRAPDTLAWIINREVRGFTFAQDGRERWVVHYQVPAGVDWQTLDTKQVIGALLGTDIDFEILSGGPWTGGIALISERFQSASNRIFLVGDAAHLYTPLGGLGMNTGIGDAMNLAWKLAALHDGWGGPALLASYESERRPIGLRNGRHGIDCAKIMGGWEIPADLEEEGPGADQTRAAFGRMCIETDHGQYNTSGIIFGERYEDSPLIFADSSPPPPDDLYNYAPHDRAGARMPHFWLADERSCFDALGRDLSLVVFGDVDFSSFEAAARERALPLTMVRQERAERPETYRSDLVLVRPDHHIAWHGQNAPADPAAVLDRARGQPG
jgi:2-polyprenyl-6-methoxyphenol hydroxylase-like FAD-dependent oxidoreductase